MNKRFSSGSTQGAPPATTIGGIIRSYGGEIKTGPFGTKLKAAEYSRSGVPVVSVGEIQHGRIVVHENTPRVGTDVTSRMPEYLLRAGDIVFARKGSVERSAVVRKDQEGWFLGSDGIRLRLPDSCNSRYFGYQIISPQTQAWLTQQATGSTMASLNQGTIERIPCLMPDRQQQDRIAEILGSLDDKIELNRRMNETLEAMARALFKSWFIDFAPVHAKAAVRRQHPNWSNAQVSRAALPDLAPAIAELFPDDFENSLLGPIPAGWKVATVGDIGDNPRRSVQPSEITPATPYIALEHMPRRCIALSEWGDADNVASGKFRFHADEILFGKLRPYFHKVGVPPIDGVCSTDVLVILPRAQHWFGLLLGHVSSDAMIAHTDTSSTGTKMPRTNWSDIARFEIAVPAEPIAAEATRQARVILSRIHAHILSSRTLASTRDSVLPRLLSGELSVADRDPRLEAARE